MAKVLTAQAVERLRPAEKRREVPDAAVPGLYLVIQPSGRRSFAVRTRLNGATIKVTLRALELAKARDEARQIVQQARDGNDPRVIRAEQKASRPVTFAELASEYVERWAKPRKRSWRSDEQAIERELLPAWGQRSAASISRRDVRSLIEAKAATTPSGGNRLLALVRKLFAWAVEQDILPATPVAGIKAPAKEQSRDRVLSDDELTAVWTATDVLGWPWGPFVQLLMLTGQRRDEVASMRWSALDLDKGLWTLTSGDTKAERAHEVPLSPVVAAILTNLPRVTGSAFVFPARDRLDRRISGYSDCKERLDELSGVSGWTFHDLRRTAASGMARLGVPPQVLAKILNHSPGSVQGITAIYNRHGYDREKRDALTAWGNYVVGLVEGRPENVVSLRAEVS